MMISGIPWAQIVAGILLGFGLFVLVTFWRGLNATFWKLIIIVLFAPFAMIGFLAALFRFGFLVGDDLINHIVDWANAKKDRYIP